MDGKVSDVITESFELALKSHSIFLRKKREVDIEIDRFSSRIRGLGYDLSPEKLPPEKSLPESFIENVVIPFQKWMDNIQSCEYQIQLDSEKE